MQYLSLAQVIELYNRIIEQSGGTSGIHNIGALESALAQPRMAFGDQDLYPTIAEKASALAFSLINNHPFVDGNKRVGQAAMEIFLVLNGYEIQASVDEQEQIILRIAAGKIRRDELTDWIQYHMVAYR